MHVEVIRSSRRRKTIEARLVGDTLEVLVPARLSKREEDDCVRDMVQRFERRRSTEGIDLVGRARRLARRHGLPAPADVRWSDNQRRRWGSCTVDTGQIRISSVLAGYPSWVLDYVLVHELAHLVEPDHGPRFHDLVARYPKAERAEGFLLAKGWGDLDEVGPEVGDVGVGPGGDDGVVGDQLDRHQIDRHQADRHQVDGHQADRGQPSGGRVVGDRRGGDPPAGDPPAGPVVQPTLF